MTVLHCTGRNLIGACVVTLWLAFQLQTTGEEPTRIYIGNDDHTDYMWTADEATYERVFCEMIDYYLKLTEETGANAHHLQSRFNCDGSYWLAVYEKNRPRGDFEKVIAALKSGHLSAPMTALVSCYGAQPAEAVLRGMYYAGRLERKHGLRFTMAVAMENQTLPLGLASLWAGSGAKYSWRGVCACATRMNKESLRQREHEIYWYTGLDGRRILMKWHSIHAGDNKQGGGYAEAFDPLAAVRYLDGDRDFLNRYRLEKSSLPFGVRAAFGFGWDALDRKTGQPYAADPKNYPLSAHFHEVARSESTSDRQVIVSNEEDFFRDFERNYGDKLPEECVALGNEWDLYSASMSETSARVRRAVEKLRSAEALATIVSLRRPEILTRHESARDLAFIDLGLYWEHDWTADGPISRVARAQWQNKLAGEIESYVDAIYRDASQELGKMIPNGAKSRRFFVMNSLNWLRSEHADLPYAGASDIHVRDDSTGVDVPHQIVTLGGETFLRILADKVPPTGYKVYEILPGTGSAPTDAAATTSELDSSTIENAEVRLVLQRDGAISSLVDKLHGNRELIDSGNGERSNDLTRETDEGDPLVIENTGPVSVSLRARSLSGLAHTSIITLYRNSNRVDIRNELSQNFSDTRYWAFSFALENPRIHTEEVGCVILNKPKAAGGDYADSHARYDHVTVNHFADMTDKTGKAGVTLSNADLSFARIGHSTPERLDTQTPEIHMLAGGQVDGKNLGIHSQNGETRFLQRFSLRPHAQYDPVAAMKFSLEHQNPLCTGVVVGSDAANMPGDSLSLLSIDNPNVIVSALKPHEDGIGKGIVVRLWNLTARAQSVQLGMLGGVTRALRISHIETPLEPIGLVGEQLATTIQAHRLESILLVPSN